jgi:hypothetical protein
LLVVVIIEKIEWETRESWNGEKCNREVERVIGHRKEGKKKRK